MYTDHDTGYPISYVAHAISLFDSHYDGYVLTIEKFVPAASTGDWQLPAICNGQLDEDPYPESRFDLFFPGKNAKVLAEADGFHICRRRNG
jgi:hypothetical protein